MFLSYFHFLSVFVLFLSGLFVLAFSAFAFPPGLFPSCFSCLIFFASAFCPAFFFSYFSFSLLFLFLPLLLWLQGAVWATDFTTLTPGQRARAEVILRQQALSAGEFVSEEKLTAGEYALLQSGEFSWASLNFSKGRLIVEAAAAQGFEGSLLGSDTLDSNMVVEAAKGTNTKLYVTTFYQEGGAPEFDSGIKEWMNANPDALTNNGGNDMVAAVTAMGYDAYFTALEALKAAGSTDPSAVLEALPGVTYEGISGSIAFDETGDAIRDTAYIKTNDTAANVWKFVTQQKAS